MKFTRSAKFALAAAASAALAVSLLTPANAATRSTVVIHDTNSLTSFNSGTPDTNLTINSAVGYLQGIGFNYYDDNKNVVQNKVFGSYKVVKNGATDFRVQYTVNPGRVWSDGTPITAVDLLLSHVLSSNVYSKAAGLGDPDSESVPAFNSNGYGGTYNDNIVGQPVLSADKMSVTLQYKQKIANWDLFGPGPSAVHTLVLISEGKKALQSVKENEAARDRFLAAYNSKNTAVLKAIAKVWSEGYNITEVNDKTNPLLFVGNGGFLVDSAVTKSSVTLKKNPKYNSGPALSGSIDTVIFKFISDGTAASQALANGELDIYAGQATADAVAALKKISGITVKGGIQSCYEHWDTRVAAAPGQPEYNGLFKGHGGKGADLRKAFLLAIPREEITEKLIRPINDGAVVLGSTFLAPGQEGYDRLVANNGSSYYVGAQDVLNAKALRLVKKYYPSASASNPVKVKVLVPGNNPRRAAEFALAKANALKAGLDLQGDVQASWSPKIQLSDYDAMFFAYCQTAVSQSGTNANFIYGGGNNRTGVNLPKLDAILVTLQAPLSNSALVSKVIAAERIIHAEGLSVGVFQFPAVTAYNKALKNVKPAPLSPNLVWNYWEWAY
ncbi:DdpA ABC-type dipeptide transport system, periplasmic component [Candidatus Nanopelagicaceae bacterium]